jgi:hypothetical protein
MLLACGPASAQEQRDMIAPLGVPAKRAAAPPPPPAVEGVKMNQIKRLQGHQTKIRAIAITRDGRWAVSGAGDQTTFFGLGKPTWLDCTARLWDLDTGKELRRFEGHKQGIDSLDLSFDGQRLLTGGSDNTVRLWDLATGQQLRQFAGTRGVFSENARLVAVASDSPEIDLYDAQTGQQLQKMVGHLGGTTCLAFADDDKLLVSGGNDGALRLWEAKTGKALRTFKLDSHTVLCVGVHVDGKHFVAVTADSIYVGDVNAPEKPARTRMDRTITQAMVFLGGRRLLLHEEGGIARAWDLELGKEQVVMEVGQARRLVISRDAKRILGASATTTDLILFASPVPALPPGP